MPYNRSRVNYDLMYRDREVEDVVKWDLTDEVLSREEKHQIQKELRWVPAEEYRLNQRAYEKLNEYEWTKKYLMTHERLRKGFFGPPNPDS